MSDEEDVVAAIGAHLRRHPADRFPLEHAAGQFHLGVALAEPQPAQARTALELACRLFAEEGRPVEQAKARNALGAVLRTLGETAAASAAFADAADAFAGAELAAERGAALFNLGLVRREAGDPAGAREALASARSLLQDTAPPAQAGAAARELGATLLLLEEHGEAVEPLREAVELAGRGRDAAGVGAAANVLGLALLAGGRAAEAVEALRTAVAHHHRRLSAEGYAMSQANLALALEQVGDQLRARTAARHALGVPGAPAPVREQAIAVLDRLPPHPADAVALLLDESRQAWPALVRAEVEWWLDAGERARAAAAAGWIAGQTASEELGGELAHALLGAALELPAEGTERILGALVRAAGEAEPPVAARFRAQLERALPRFHVPQWKRLEATLDRLVTEAGQQPWSTS